MAQIKLHGGERLRKEYLLQSTTNSDKFVRIFGEINGYKLYGRFRDLYKRNLLRFAMSLTTDQLNDLENYFTK
jgi:hypothetical protein